MRLVSESNDFVMKELILFSDGSVNTLTKVGFGAYLLVSDLSISPEILKNQVKIKQFENTSSTKLELETLLWALNDIDEKDCSLIVYTDSQNIANLLVRREKLEASNYMSKKNRLIDNHALYKEYFFLADKIGFKTHKIKGHDASRNKSLIDNCFTLVDRASRSALRMSKR